MTRRPRAARAAWAAAFGIGVVGVLCHDSSYVALRPLGTLPLVWVAVWVLAVAGVVLSVPPRKALLAIVPAFLVAAYLTGFVAMASTWDDTTDREVTQRLDAPGHEVLVVGGHVFMDDVWEVRVRSGDGLLARERTVWQVQSPGYGTPPRVTLTGPRSLEVAYGDDVDRVTF